MKSKCIILLFILPWAAQAEEKIIPINEIPANIHLDLPLLDIPYNLKQNYSFPSMRQSVVLTKDIHQLAHYGLFRLVNPKTFWQYVASDTATVIFDVAFNWLLPMPLSTVWLHEEWHRAILGQYGISSHNDTYRFSFLADVVTVNHVKDEDLIKLKLNHPADQVRLSAAGIEADKEVVTYLEKEQFFYDNLVGYRALYIMQYLSCAMYIGNISEANELTKIIQKRENENISERDIVGHDFTAWVYDLFRPKEPYENRGMHPSGIGIDRYITYDDLTNEEKSYIKTQKYLHILNFIDPFLLDSVRFDTAINGHKFSWNASLRHHLTSFGYTIDVNTFFRRKSLKLFFVAHNYVNKDNYFPGIDSELIRFPITKRVNATSRLALWLQPFEQQFFTSAAQLGGLVSIKGNIALVNNLEFYAELEGKTKGWVAGNPNLNAGYRVGSGLLWRLWT